MRTSHAVFQDCTTRLRAVGRSAVCLLPAAPLSRSLVLSSIPSSALAHATPPVVCGRLLYQPLRARVCRRSEEIRRHPEFRFDYFLLSRSQLDLHRRVDVLIRLVSGEKLPPEVRQRRENKSKVRSRAPRSAARASTGWPQAEGAAEGARPAKQARPAAVRALVQGWYGFTRLTRCAPPPQGRAADAT